MKFFRTLALAALASLVTLSPASAAETRKYDDAAFAAAQAAGRPILVDVKAWWCPVCASQGRTLKKAITAPEFKQLVIFDVNYDKQKQVMRKFNVTKQATLIGFNGTRQTGRLDGVTDRVKISNLLVSTLPK